MALEPGGIIAWLLVGLIAGALAGLVMRGGGYGIVGDMIVGLIGAFVGGLLFGLVFPGSVPDSCSRRCWRARPSSWRRMHRGHPAPLPWSRRVLRWSVLPLRARVGCRWVRPCP